MFSLRSLTVGLIAAVAVIVGPAVVNASAGTSEPTAPVYAPQDTSPWGP